MNNQRIIDWVDGLFASYEQTDEVREQKEELLLHMTDRIKEHMSDSMDFDGAFKAAKDDLGDLNELLTGFDKKRRDESKWDGGGRQENRDRREYEEEKMHRKPRVGRISFNGNGIVALSPFIYLVMGFWFGMWAWGWLIIPCSAILFGGSNINYGHRIIALSPFIYLFMGFFFGWWAWGWLIIPASAIIFGAVFTVDDRWHTSWYDHATKWQEDAEYYAKRHGGKNKN